MAAPAGPGSAQDIVVLQEPGVVVSVPNPAQKVKGKPGPVTGSPTAAGGGGVTPNLVMCGNACYLFPDSQRTITPPGGSSGVLESNGQTNWIEWVPPLVGGVTKVDYYNTNSYSAWYGSSPFNCTSVKNQDVWDVDYVAVSWSYGGTPSGSTNFGSGRIGYDNTVSNTWKVSHSIQHVYLSVTGGTIYWVDYEVHGSYQFGSSFYTTDAYSSSVT